MMHGHTYMKFIEMFIAVPILEGSGRGLLLVLSRHTPRGTAEDCEKPQTVQQSLCFVDRATLYIHSKKDQLHARFILSILRQTPLHVSGVSAAHHQEVHRMDTTLGTYILSVVLEPSQDSRQ